MRTGFIYALSGIIYTPSEFIYVLNEFICAQSIFICLWTEFIYALDDFICVRNCFNSMWNGFICARNDFWSVRNDYMSFKMMQRTVLIALSKLYKVDHEGSSWFSWLRTEGIIHKLSLLHLMNGKRACCGACACRSAGIAERLIRFE